MQVLTKYLTLFIIKGYLLFVALGSAPIWIGPIKLDNLIGLGLAISAFMLLLSSGRLAGVGQWILIAGIFYFITLLNSVIFSQDPMYSAKRMLIIGGYIFVSLVTPYLLKNCGKSVGISSLFSACLSAIIIWLSYLLIGMSSWGRMTIPTIVNGRPVYFPGGWGTSSDPNILGFGLLLTLLFGLAASRPPLRISLLITIFIFSASLLTMSRTAIFAISLALLFVLVWYSFLRIFSSRETIKLPMSKLVIGFSSVFLIILLAPTTNPLDLFLQRVFNSEYSLRLEIFRDVYGNWGNSLTEVFFGVGFDIARISRDPHNIYLTALHDSGVFGVFGLCTFLFFLFNFLLKCKILYYRLWSMLIFWFIVIGGLSYWHTKTFWVSIMFIISLRQIDHYQYENSKGLNSEVFNGRNEVKRAHIIVR
jgi:hypothetical protein